MDRIFIILFILLIQSPCSLSWAQEQLLSRQERTALYLEEFASPAFQSDSPRIGQALKNVLNKLPGPVYETITLREFPVVFIASLSSGIARFANATEFTFRKEDEPAFQKGFYLITLSDELNSAVDVQAIEGVIAHEIAHRYLEHLKNEIYSCELEKEANRQVKAWGFEEAFLKAKGAFGSKSHTDSPCSATSL